MVSPPSPSAFIAPMGLPGGLNGILDDPLMDAGLTARKRRRTPSVGTATASGMPVGWRFRCLPAPATGPPPGTASCRLPKSAAVDLAIHGQANAGIVPLRPAAPSPSITGGTRGRAESGSRYAAFRDWSPSAPIGGTEGVKEKGDRAGEPLALLAEDDGKAIMLAFMALQALP
jgi:hypothetical protein